MCEIFESSELSLEIECWCFYCRVLWMVPGIVHLSRDVFWGGWKVLEFFFRTVILPNRNALQGKGRFRKSGKKRSSINDVTRNSIIFLILPKSQKKTSQNLSGMSKIQFPSPQWLHFGWPQIALHNKWAIPSFLHGLLFEFFIQNAASPRHLMTFCSRIQKHSLSILRGKTVKLFSCQVGAWK